MTSSLSMNNTPSNINTNKKNKNRSNMATSLVNNNKNYNKNSKKIDEVREVIQNKPEADIIKVLDFFDNDVSKTIDAFLSDGGKEVMKKWSDLKSAKKQNTLNEQKSNKTKINDEKKDNNNNISNNDKRNQQSSNKQNLNDLVASIINQYTSADQQTVPQKQEVKLNSNVSIPLIQPAQTQQQQNLLQNLNNLVNSSQPLSKAMSGLKVTVLGIEQPNKYDAASSVSSSPSSMSVVSSLSSASDSNKQQRPQLLELNKQQQPQRVQQQKQFNTNYINPNAKNVLEKSTKDLQRQTVALNKIQHQFQNDLNTSQHLFTKTFNNLKKLIDERQMQLQSKLNQLAQTGNDILAQRQQKANDLKIQTDNAVHLNDNELLELKADIKHFLSERQLDEEFTKIKFFEDEPLKNMCQSIQSFGTIAQIKNQYSTERPPLNEVLNSASPNPTPSIQQETSQLNANFKQQANRSNGNTNNTINKVNGTSVNIIDDEGEFIEVKRPRKFKLIKHSQNQN